ncbi:MAG TPA: hypothetical protein VGP79_09185 [Bryobacteraceae bacterium]|jgi:hypothetical protein|nr:hypothetical protein [Bryobacteraceae bacterium]
MRCAALLILASLAGSVPLLADGVAPRATASDYPAFQRTQDFFIGATLVSADQVKRVLPADVAKKYVVVEVAFYPRDGATVEVFAFDFSLRFGKELETHPVNSEETATGSVSHGRGPKIPEQVHVEKEVGVIVATGTDPVTGRRGTGVGTYEGIGVGIGGGSRRSSPPPSSGGSAKADRIEQQLRDKALPEGKTTAPVAGYLYFPKKGANGPGELKYIRNSIQVVLQLPVVK